MKRALVLIVGFILFGLSLTESLGIAHGMPSLLGAFSPLNQAAGWQQLTANGASDSPSARYGHAVAWDAQAGRLLLFGGRAGTSSRNDLWQYTSTSGWQQLTPSGTRTAPPGRQQHSAVWDSTNNRLLVFGGTDGSLWFGDLWQYTSADGWRQLGAAGTAAAPPPRYSHAAAWDSQSSRLLVFGGYVQQVGISNDLWEYTTAGGWKVLTRNDPEGSPPARYDHAAVWDAQSNRLLVFGGTVRQVGNRNDLWQYTSAGGWQMLTADGASAAAPRRAGHTAVWDTQSSRMLVFGGEILSVGTGNDLWQHTAAGGWQQLSALRATGAPPSRTWHGAAWDNRSNRLLVFGGLDRSTQYNDLWQYGAVAPASTPTPASTRTPPTGLATVVGRVQLSDGTVPADDQILVLAGDGSGRQITARVTGGAFTLSLPAGTYQLTVLSRDDRFEPPAVRSLTVAAGERRDLGTISLVERPSVIMGRLLSEGRGVCGLTVQAVQLVDDTDRARSARAVTGSDGSYRLAVTAGRWSVSILEGRPVQAGCAEAHRDVWRPEPPEVIVTVGLGETKVQNLAGVAASASLSGGTARPASVSVPLQGRLIASAAPVTLNGGIAARLVGSSEPATTAPIVNGAFLLNLKPGTYRLEVGIPTNGGFLPSAPQQITVGEGENTPIEIPVTPYDAVIQGTVRRPDGSPLTGESVTVFASNGAGGAVEESSDPATGIFRLRVGGGQWLLDVKPGATSSFLGDVTQRDRWVATVSSGQTATADVNVEPLMGDLSGVTRKPNGQPLGGASVLIRRQIVSKNPAPVAAVVSDAAGRYSVRLPLGDYEVTASASESVATSVSGLDVGATQVGRPSLGPSLRKIQLRSGQPNVAIDLPFRSADATISGTINLPTPGEGLVRAYSSSGAHTSVRTVGGRFELPVTPDDTWTVDAVAEQGTTSPEVFRAPPKSVDVRGPASVGVSLGLVSDGQLPPSFNWRFDPTQPRNFKLGDGAEIIIPEGALQPNAACADKTLVLSANVRVERPQQQSLQLIGKSYEVTARDCFGPVASPFLKPVRIRLPLPERAGAAIQPTTDVGGLQAGTRHRVMLPFIAKAFTGSPVTSAADLVPGYYSPLAKSWLPLVRSGERWAGKGGAGGSALLGAFEIEVDHFTEWSILATGGGA